MEEGDEEGGGCSQEAGEYDGSSGAMLVDRVPGVDFSAGSRRRCFHRSGAEPARAHEIDHLTVEPYRPTATSGCLSAAASRCPDQSAGRARARCTGAPVPPGAAQVEPMSIQEPRDIRVVHNEPTSTTHREFQG